MHHEKAGFLGKDNNVGKNRRQEEKRKTEYEMDGPHERSYRHEFTGAEQGCWGQGIMDTNHSEGCQKSEPIQ